MSAIAFVTRHVETLYWIGDIVYLRTRTDKIAGMVTTVSVRPNGLLYCVGWGTGTETWHYEMELTAEYVPDFGQ